MGPARHFLRAEASEHSLDPWSLISFYSGYCGRNIDMGIEDDDAVGVNLIEDAPTREGTS